MDSQRIKAFEPIFYPRSIAVVGASRDPTKSGTRYFKSLLATRFKGELYAVNPGGGTILGQKAYPRLTAIPGPVDYVIVAVPNRLLPGLLDDIEAKGVKTVQFFTAGFRETGTQKGLEMELDLARRARKSGFRVIGPNCIGVYNPSINMPYGMAARIGEPGTVGFISQSGGVAGKIVKAGYIRGINFSKAVSFGNGCDLDSVDYFAYFMEDPQTEIIGAYLEGVQDGERLLDLLKQISPEKPIVLWKGGRTEAGAATARSHTGSMTASDAVWASAARQLGIVFVRDVDEMADALLVLQHFRSPPGRRLSIISGIMGGGGGDSVSASDTCETLGLQVIPFSEENQDALEEILPPAGAILRNPLDLGSIGGNLPAWERVLDLVSGDRNVELIIIQEPMDDLMVNMDRDSFEALHDLFIRFRKTRSTPILLVVPPGFAVEGLEKEQKRLAAAGIPIFPSLKRAARAIVDADQYFRVHGKRK